MSMNLLFKNNGVEVPICQTPTQITYALMVSSKGNELKLTGKKAVRVLRGYMNWRKYSLSGSWESIEEFEEAKSMIEEELNELKPYLESKDLVVFVV